MMNQLFNNPALGNQAFGDLFEKFASSNKTAVDAAIAFNDIVVRTQGALARKQLEVFETCLDAGAEQLKLVSATKDPKDLVTKQTAAAVSLSEKVVGAAQASLEIQNQARDELAAWVEDGFKTVTEASADAKPAKPAARKAA